ncbi:MAG: DegV family EDD domain-containing protein [Clostridia bacterium]|nr:DegV family EDD domain-containing protein [Clostridia bacterium]
MVCIISDTSTLYSTQQAREAGFAVSPLAVTIAGNTYRELDEMTPEKFVEIIAQGHMPASSQPAIGEVMDLYQEYAGEEIINISMADGLSGTYQSAVAAAEGAANITVVNTTTLCGPHRYMVQTAARLAQEGRGKQEILDALDQMMATDVSYLMPADFDYLRRGGRLSPLVSLVGKTIKLAPVLTQSEDGCQLVMSAVKRSYKQALIHVAKKLAEHGVGKGWRIYITHAVHEARLEEAKAAMEAAFPEAVIECYTLTPAFITQGGPACVAIQVVKEI